MKNSKIINIINSGNSNIAYIKTKNHQIMASTGYTILKCELMIKKTLATNLYSLLMSLLVGWIPSLTLVPL